MNNEPTHPEELVHPSLAHYTQILENLYTHTDVPPMLTWTDVEALRSHSLQSTTSERRVTAPVWVRLSPFSTKRVAVIFAVVLLMIVMTGTVLAAGGFDALLRSLAQNEYGTSYLLTKDQFTPLNQTKRTGALIGTLQAAYADANRLIVGISIDDSNLPSAGAGGEWTLIPESLTTSDGIKLPSRGTYYKVDSKDMGSLMSYDASQIQGNPASLRIHAVFSYYCSDLNGGKCSPQARVHNLANPFRLIYDFTVPFHSGRIVTVKQAVTSNDKTLTLERVVITPSETRFYLHGISYFDFTAMHLQRSGNSDTTLTTDERTYTLGGPTSIGDPTDARNPHKLDTYISALEPLANSKHGTWTLHIPNATKGPGWIFRFSV
jgi:hypothetical protein